jgi:DNA-binding NtrC family response regulator
MDNSARKSYFASLGEKTHEIEMPEELASAKRKVLMLEDDEDLTSLLARTLERVGCSVTVVSNGVEGLRHIMAGDFDLIVCDMVMPKLPGDMFFMAVERTKPHLCKRFLFMTGHTAEKRWDDFARAKGCLILWKPFELHVFVESAQAIMNKHGIKDGAQ